MNEISECPICFDILLSGNYCPTCDLKIKAPEDGADNISKVDEKVDKPCEIF